MISAVVLLEAFLFAVILALAGQTANDQMPTTTEKGKHEEELSPTAIR
ncbi:hypothetical protein PI124_g2158 [Phytophthora idaei]|nr:hypothetical protein PI125_g1802 [Phytophthora idaei]KAG3172462.1 hypothetical protein PI126_g1323 [Phytophthora idaei]KAG3253260.1 hypothetical protein PI124_g2158 [Phytophthora idaei]